ncbi:MAG: YafY family transcriptional regulator [Rhizobiales bacterium]|nr:YafY family transcriptional regulator [Hyphomicrobiales bacterium]MBO6699829.1 YafY family transcriptional regulator [Hyphomicrobiales bacterium]MBO6737367.1 YafY family transcriptional regulator [Hyphomicrobiales bacterium]MBO6911559.1 YafY family transcriptional regulator [Hyphomicrobiales bacterium]MBO6955141.1 YafY family transcriptional regulator [Hyphomicrobiales bacterium]
MRRADRLFQIVQLLRGGRLVTARMLADKLEVSERTIYRDIVDLQGSGVPVEGEAGVGYIMRDGYDLPPLMFTRDEIASLVAGARMVRAWGGLSMARAAEEALVKIGAVLPDAKRPTVEATAIFAPSFEFAESQRETLDLLDRAIDRSEKLSMDYTDAKGDATQRTVRPLGLYFWGKVWTLLAWCELREDFRGFRVDRIIEPIIDGTRFKAERGKQLVDFYRKMEAEGWPRHEH